jgi:hypothetical protein
VICTYFCSSIYCENKRINKFPLHEVITMKSKIKVYFGSYGFECISEEILNTEIWMWGDLN